eukprot:3273526-Rhodomonas_salina.1
MEEVRVPATLIAPVGPPYSQLYEMSGTDLAYAHIYEKRGTDVGMVLGTDLGYIATRCAEKQRQLIAERKPTWYFPSISYYHQYWHRGAYYHCTGVLPLYWHCVSYNHQYWRCVATGTNAAGICTRLPDLQGEGDDDGFGVVQKRLSNGIK